MITLQDEQGFIKLYRKFMQWEWYTNVNVKTLFLHCLMKANYKHKKYQGIDIERGEFLTSIKSLSIETGLSERQIRTALDKLIMTNELTSKSNNKYRIIKVLKYNDYQTIDNQDDKQVTNKRQASDKQVTTTKKEKKEKNDNKVKKYNPFLQTYYDDKDLNELFIDFLKMRKQLKAINSERAVNTLIKKLESLTKQQKIDCIIKSIENSWKGVYVDNYIKDTKPTESTKSKEIKKNLFGERKF